MRKIIAACLCLCLCLALAVSAFAEETESVLDKFVFGSSYEETWNQMEDLKWEDLLQIEDWREGYSITFHLTTAEYGSTGPFTASFSGDKLITIANGNDTITADDEGFISYDDQSALLREIFGDPAYTSEAGTKAERQTEDGAIVNTEDSDFEGGSTDVHRYEQWIVEKDGKTLLFHHYEYDITIDAIKTTYSYNSLLILPP